MQFNFRNYGKTSPEMLRLPEKNTHTRSGRAVKNPSSRYVEWNGADVILGTPEMLLNSLTGNPWICELLDRIRKSQEKVRGAKKHTPELVVCAATGRVQVELKLSKKTGKKTRSRIGRCKSDDDIRTILMEEKIWRVTFKEHQSREDKVPGDGWCGYLSIDQVRRGEEVVGKIDKEGTAHLIDTIDELIKTGSGGVRQNWRNLKSRDLTTREVLYSVKDTLINWKNRLTSSLEPNRWLNAKNIYGTCKLWGYSQWGTDSEDASRCEMRDCYFTQGTTTNYEEWKWAMSRAMIVGARKHYYVRKGGLSDDFEEAFGRAIEIAMEQIKRGLEEERSGLVSESETECCVIAN
jgi:hypothetical protein